MDEKNKKYGLLLERHTSALYSCAHAYTASKKLNNKQRLRVQYKQFWYLQKQHLLQ